MNDKKFTDEITEQIALQVSLIKFEGVSKLTRLFAMLFMTLIAILFISTALIFTLIGVAYLVAPAIGGIEFALLGVAFIILLLLAIIYLCRKSLIESPLVRFLYKLFFKNQDK